MLSLYLLSFVLTLLFLQYLWSRRKLYMLSWKLPGPIPYPLIGNAWAFRNPDTILDKIRELRYIYKKTATFWLGTTLFVYAYSPEDVEKVLTSPDCLNKSSVYRFIGNFFGQGIFISERDKWTKHRRLMNPSFSYKVLLSFFPIFNRELDVLVGKLETMVGKGDFSVLNFVTRCNMDISGQTTMGTKLNTQNMQNEEILEAYAGAKYISGLRIFSPWLQPESLFRLSKWYKIQEKSKRTLISFIDNLIDSKCSRASINRTSIPNKKLDEDLDTIKKNGNIFIDQAIKLVYEKQFTWSDVHHESNFLVLASVDTTALTITNIIQCLAMYPDCQEKVIEEIRSIFPNDDFEVTYEDTKNMVYCDLVINETLRLFPVVPVMARRTINDFRLRDDIVIPKSTNIVIDQLGLHRDPEYWGPTANTFDPTRFLDFGNMKIHPYAYIPFSKGQRNCIGWQYAMFSLKVFMAKIFRKYRFTTDQKLEDFKFRMEIALTSLITPTVQIHKL